MPHPATARLWRPATRAKRIAGTAEHVLAPRRPAPRRPIERPLWTCPECGSQFAGVVPRQRWANLEMWLPRRLDGPRFARVETLYPNTHIHALRLREVAEVDEELRGWLAEAYAVGAGNG